MPPEPVAHDAFVHVSDRMAELLQRATRLAQTDEPLLLLGETGTGKEVLARWMHRHGPRRAEPFVPIDCPGIPPSLLHSVLFGHSRGAFTGAACARLGLLRAAGEGTVLLDEIADIGPDVQTALLRAVDRREVYAVGDDRPFTVGARILSATSRDVEARAQSGAFRADLVHRLGTYVLEVPPLRERREDVVPLARHALRLLGSARCAGKRLGPTATAALLGYEFPGNVRELMGIVRQAAIEGTSPDLAEIAEIVELRRQRRRTAVPSQSSPRDAVEGANGTEAILRRLRAERRPSIARLARIMNTSEKTMRRRVHRLVDAGVVSMLGRGRGAYLEVRGTARPEPP